MAGDNRRIVPDQSRDAPQGVDHPADRSPVRPIDERQAVAHEDVTGVDDVRIAEEHHGVAVRMRRPEVDDVDLVVVVVEADGFPEGDLGQSLFRVRLLEPVGQRHDLVRLHPPSAVFLSHDDRAGPPEVLVPVGVVVVPVGVDDEVDRVVGQLSYSRRDLLGERRELVVDDERAVVPDRDPDVPTAPLKHVDGLGDPHCPDLDVVEVLGRTQRGAG